MVSEPVRSLRALPMCSVLTAASIIVPLNGTGRSDNTTWDDEYTLVVSDWYHRQHDDMLYNDFLTWTNPTGAEPVPGELERHSSAAS